MKQMETGRSTVDHEFIRTDDILEMEGLRAELGAATRRKMAGADHLSGRAGVCGMGRLTEEDIQILLAGGPL
jgi:hypothetical protein